MVLSQTHGGQNGGRWQLGQTGMCLPQSSDGSDRRRDMYHPIHDLGVANCEDPCSCIVLCGITPSPYVCTSFGFVVSDKVKSRGKGYLSIFFRPAVPLPQNDYRYLSSSDARLSRDFGIC